MKHIFVLIIVLATACSGPSGGNDGPPAPRPGQEPGHDPARVLFSPSTADFASEDGCFVGSMTVEMVRRGDYLPDTLYIIEVSDRRGALSVQSNVVFARNDSVSAFSLRYSLTLEAGEEYSATVSAVGTDASMTITFRNTSNYMDVGTASYRYPGGRATVRMRRRDAGGISEYSLAGDGISRVFSVDGGGNVKVSNSPAGTDGYESVADVSTLGSAPPSQPSWRVGGCADATGVFVLGAVYTRTDGTRLLSYDTVTILDADCEWSEPADALFTDGWLLGVVSFEGRPPLIPAGNPWAVEYRESRSHPGLFRFINIYRGESPLTPLNAGPALTYITVDATDADNVTIAEQNAGFVNADLFPHPFHIGGTGTMRTEPDGTRTITIAQPLHNGYGTWGDTWAARYPSVFRIPRRF